MGEINNRKISVVGLFENRAELDEAISSLLTQGFRASDISVLLPDAQDTKQVVAREKHTKAPGGALVGATVGGAIGGALGLLAGLGAIAIPGIGQFIVAGPILAALAGAGVGGAVGSLAGSLVGLGIPELEAKRDESLFTRGGALSRVRADESDSVEHVGTTRDRAGASSAYKTLAVPGLHDDEVHELRPM